MSKGCFVVLFILLNGGLIPIGVFVLLRPELPPNMQKHNTPNKTQTTNKHRRRSDLNPRRIVGVKPQDAGGGTAGGYGGGGRTGGRLRRTGGTVT